MRLAVVVCLTFVVAASAVLQPQTRYHELIGIPAAIEIKKAENGIQSRIAVGGGVAAAFDFPYLAGLVIPLVNVRRTSTCGSSLISRNRLVTAAHCWRDTENQAAQFIVVLGSQYLFSGGTRIPTSHVVVHPQWDPNTFKNDVAIIYLPISVTLSRLIQPVALPHDSLGNSFEGQWATAVGYGKTSDSQPGVPANSVVSYVNLQIISLASCQTAFGAAAQPSNICTNGYGGVGICGGDSGGPLVVNQNGRHVLIGISSYVSIEGCQRGRPSAFSRVTAFYNFIRQNI